MKRSTLLLGLLLLWVSCENQSLSPVEQTLVGTWRLAEYCVSPGTGSCIMQPATAIQTQTLEFRKDGSFIERIPDRQKFWTPLVSSGEYRVLQEQSRIEFRFDASASTYPASWEFRLEPGQRQAGQRLTLLPTCFEGCTYVFEKIR
jgi:hypothetical protein